MDEKSCVPSCVPFISSLADESIAALDVQVPWTGYVDAVDDGNTAGGESLNPFALSSRPALTEFHSNFYQTDGGLDGTRVEEADENFDRTNEGVIDHGNIDDEPFVHEIIRARIDQRVQR